jgi:hypothetical protein
MTSPSSFKQAAAVRAIDRLRNILDAIEYAARVDGDFVTIDRQTADSIIDDVRAAARDVRELAEGVR